ncbi:MAG TPA: GntR family transcriptional regulator [Burkholderiaceae bacterium]|nr:GntR family transcriptional regulator [Burkholderiaceae bacterium]
MNTSRKRKNNDHADAATKSSKRLAPPEPRRRLTDIAYERLEEAIVTMQIPPGSVVSEQTLSEMLDIGRTPTREAIQQLAREHLLQVLPQRGLLVPDIDLRKQLRLLETRREVERLVCRSAARRATPEQREAFFRLRDEFLHSARENDDLTFIRADREFNELSLKAARNEFSEGAMRLMHGLSRRFWYGHHKQVADLSEIAQLHAAVADAIGRGDSEAAGTSLDALLDNIEEFAKSTLTYDL